MPDHKVRQQLSRLLESAIDKTTVDAVYLTDREGGIHYANNTACKLLGYKRSELLSLNIYDLDADIRTKTALHEHRRLMQKKQGLFETRHRRKDNTILPVEVAFSNITLDGIGYSLSFIRDISHRKEVERHNQELSFAIENSADCVYLFDVNGNIFYTNTTACITLGYNREEMLRMNVLDFTPDFPRAEWPGHVEQIRRGNIPPFVVRHYRKDGTTLPVEVNVTCKALGDTEIFCAFARDITDRKQIEEENEKLLAAMENATDAVYIFDSNGRIQYANRSAAKELGYNTEELRGMRIRDIDPTLADSPTREAQRRERWREAQKGEQMIFETSHMRKDGSIFPVECSHSTVAVAGGEHIGISFARNIAGRKEEQRKLQFLQSSINSAGDAIFITKDNTILYANQTACSELGYTREELLQLKAGDINPEYGKFAGDIENWHEQSVDSVFTVETLHKRKDGTTFPVETNLRIIRHDGEAYNCTVVRDITERKKVETALQESEERFRVITETSPVALLISRISDGVTLYANKQAEYLFGIPYSRLIGKSLTDIFDTPEARSSIMETLQSGTPTFGREILLHREDDTRLCISMNARSIHLQNDEVICCAMLDITEAYELAEQLSYQARYDSLTNLVNRREFQNHLKRVIVSADKNNSENALCYMDLDQFKIVNDTCGHVAGDELLRQIGQLLQNNVRKRDILARLGGDEFAILLENCNLQQAERVANTIRQSVHDFRFRWEEHTFNIGVSIGLVPIAFGSETATDVLRRADTACYEAKDTGRNRVYIYHADDEELTKRHGEMQWISRINEALEENRLQLWSQKIIPLNPNNENGEHYEILLRMQDRNGSIIPPGAFLPTAERYDIAPRIDRWVITTILNWYSQNPERLKRLGICSINLSGQSLSEEELLTYIINYFENSGLPAGKFCFEITETAAIANLAYATHFIKTLKEHGFRFALDDFGSGLSSFAYLKNLPVDFIKIDGLFVKDILDDPIDLAMVKSINEIGHVMNKITIAEFVESREIQEKLREVGVDYAQGYGIDRPTPLINASDVHKIYK